jgi:hypothetical protein
MIARVAIGAALLVALAVVAGCTERGAYTPEEFQRLMLARGDGVQLFGPTPLPLGGEDQGYFASLRPVRGTETMFDYHEVQTQTWIWDVEDNRQPGQSYDRRGIYSRDFRTSYR